MTDKETLILAAKCNGRLKHGLNNTPEHRAWVSMKQRCTNQNKREWPHYGGRGIKVCERWMQSFIAFLSDVGHKPSSKHSLDRIDVNGDYAPGNVRWATQKEQCANRQHNRLITYKGETKTLSAWAQQIGISQGRLHGRLSSGWSVEEAIEIQPARGRAGGPRGKNGRFVSDAEKDKARRYASTRAAALIGREL